MHLHSEHTYIHTDLQQHGNFLSAKFVFVMGLFSTWGIAPLPAHFHNSIRCAVHMHNFFIVPIWMPSPKKNFPINCQEVFQFLVNRDLPPPQDLLN